MKKWFLISFLILAAIGKIDSQNYFPKGATWYFDIPPFITPQFSYSFLESKGDTIVNGDTLTFISGGDSCSPMANLFLKQVGLKIYKLNPCNSTYSLLYNFGANTGDTLVIFPKICTNNDSVLLKIDSINIININGNNLKQFYTRQLNWSSNWYFDAKIIEGIGSTYFLYPQIAFCDPLKGPLRCYSDSVIGNYSAGLHNGVCDTTFSVGIQDYNQTNLVKLFPNPTKGLIQVKTELPIEKIEVYDLESKKILETHNLLVDMTNFSKGIYFLKLFSQKRVIYKRILKE